MDTTKFDSLYEEEYYDEYNKEYDESYDNTDVIDNSNLIFYNKNICIRLNNNIEKNERLKKVKKSY